MHTSRAPGLLHLLHQFQKIQVESSLISLHQPVNSNRHLDKKESQTHDKFDRPVGTNNTSTCTCRQVGRSIVKTTPYREV